MSDLISRQAVIDAVEKESQVDGAYGYMDTKSIVDLLNDLPSAHPELDEWCTDCKEYDHERHCCPRYNRVIRESLAEIREAQSTEPEITDKQAIEHLQSTGWMQNHDREMYDMGLKEQLADDSGSYDSLLPSAQPEADKVARDIATIIENEKDMRIILADERLEPKKPYTYYSNPPYKTLLARCPNCKRPLRPGRTYRNPDLYCPRCGQAIDWSEEK